MTTVRPAGFVTRLSVPMVGSRFTISPGSVGRLKTRCASRYPLLVTKSVCRPIGKFKVQGVVQCRSAFPSKTASAPPGMVVS